MPLISVVVPVRQAHHTILQTLQSLIAQCAELDAEIIVAVTRGDSSLNGIDTNQVRVLTVEPPAGVPQLRSAAAALAGGDFLVITEDHCTFRPGWLQALVQAAAERPGSVCGGPVENGLPTYVGWAQYFTRYAALGNNLPGNNACYPRALIESRLPLLQDGFWEAEFNRTLAASGVPFVMLPSLAVLQHQHRGALEYIALRFRHGRCYGARRKSRMLLFSPLLPALLYWRMLRARWNHAWFLATSPLILIYVLAWSIGEVTGSLRGAGSSCTETD